MIHKWQAVDPFEGYVEMEIVKYQERMKILNDLNMKANSTGEVVLNKDMIDQLDKMREYVLKYIRKFAIVHKDSGTEFNSLEELEFYEEYQEVLNSLSGLMLNGAKLGNSRKKASNSKRSGQ